MLVYCQTQSQIPRVGTTEGRVGGSVEGTPDMRKGESTEDWRHEGMRKIFRVYITFYKLREYQLHFQGLIQVPRYC